MASCIWMCFLSPGGGGGGGTPIIFSWGCAAGTLIPYPRPKLSNFYTLFKSKLAENHTLHSGTYLYSSYMGVPPLGSCPSVVFSFDLRSVFDAVGVVYFTLVVNAYEYSFLPRTIPVWNGLPFSVIRT